MRKVGLFGGTFDPIHFGHLNLALQISEKHCLDEVFFCPASQSPFKKEKSYASPQERLEMVRLSIEGIPGFHILDHEVKKEGISYTVETLRFLQSTLNDPTQLYLLLSQDALPSFHKWKSAKEIVQLAQPLVGTRKGFSHKITPSPVSASLHKGLTTTTQMEISSTEIRDRLKRGLYCGHLVPAKVLNYLANRNLYL